LDETTAISSTTVSRSKGHHQILIIDYLSRIARAILDEGYFSDRPKVLGRLFFPAAIFKRGWVGWMLPRFASFLINPSRFAPPRPAASRPSRSTSLLFLVPIPATAGRQAPSASHGAPDIQRKSEGVFFLVPMSLLLQRGYCTRVV